MFRMANETINQSTNCTTNRQNSMIATIWFQTTYSKTKTNKIFIGQDWFGPESKGVWRKNVWKNKVKMRTNWTKMDKLDKLDKLKKKSEKKWKEENTIIRLTRIWRSLDKFVMLGDHGQNGHNVTTKRGRIVTILWTSGKPIMNVQNRLWGVNTLQKT